MTALPIPSGVYVRWQKDQPREVSTLPSIAPDHPAADYACLLCDQKLGGPAPVVLFALGPDDEEAREEHRAGHWYPAQALVLHAACLATVPPDMGADDQLMSAPCPHNNDPLTCVLCNTPPPDQAVITEALTRLGNYITTCARDWSDYHADAWIYGLFCGWECETDHDHDVCTDAMEEVATMHGWADETVARLRRYRAAIAALQNTAVTR